MQHALHEKALCLAKEFKSLEAELTDVLRQIDQEKIFRSMGYASLFEYATKGLALTESVAYGFITVARKSQVVPKLKAAIELGTISVSQAKRVTSVITKENAEDLIQKVQTLTQRELEKEVAKINPKAATPDTARYVTESRLDIRFGASEAFMKKLKRVQDLVSQKSSAHSSYEASLEEALNCYLEKNDPVRKAARAKPSSRKVTRGDLIRPSPIQRRPISAIVRHEVNLRDQGRCTYISPDGKRCENERWLECHHVVPVYAGGENTLDNLTTLCFGHHKGEHLRH